ncbi:Cation-transporting ATPase [Aphelenchoides fujianensis]|nr:Cation-transporting ATPase [Aphelenchoides fujianensis]
MSNHGTRGADRRNIFPIHVSISDNQIQALSGDPTGDGRSPGAQSTCSAHYSVIEINDEQLQIWAYRTSMWKWILTLLASILTAGLLRLVLYWYPRWYVMCTAAKSTMDSCTHILVLDDHQNMAFRKVRIARAKPNNHLCLPLGERHLEVQSIRYFTYRKLAYLWHPVESRFATVDQLEGCMSTAFIHRWWKEQTGLDNEEIERRLVLYGKNLIDVKLKPIVVLLCKEVITPFYIFQVFSVLIWYSDDYAYYASIIVGMSVLSISMDVYQIRRQEQKLRSMVHSEDVVDVLRNGGNKQQISSSMLVPGDVLLIPPHGCILQCDCVLMNGTVILNESMLTGESVPVTKDHSKHIMFCGTPSSFRTAYTTLKGQLVRSIMYPKPVDFRFTKDLFRFVGFLAAIAAIGFCYTITIMIIRGSAIKKILLRSLDIITIVVPPALPAVMSVGIFAAQMRLRAKQIFCISPSTINTCGAINVVCFDKTGTLTEDGLDFHCHDPTALDYEFGEEATELHMDELPRDGELVKAVASCHSLTRIDNQLCGDPLDLILFNKTNWKIDESAPEEDVDETELFDMLQPTVVRSPNEHFNPDTDVELAVIRQFTFSSSLQRMAVIVHNPNEDGRRQHLYVKGAPEIVASLCKQETVPDSYQSVVNAYAQHGYRLIAVACKSFEMNYAKAQKVKRECGIIRPHKRAFLLEHGGCLADGAVHLTLRQSVSSSEELAESEEGSLNVDGESGHLFDSSYQLAVSGSTFAAVCEDYPELVEQLVCVCDVYARMSPDQKQMVINRLQDVDYTVAMCGDGANDCAALKAAHAGISLSEAEASIAAPFTSKIPDIRCVPMYMAGYSLTQFITIMQLYWLNTNLTDFQFLYIDLGLITLVALFFGYTPACDKLYKVPPPTRLLSLASALSIIGQLVIVASFQLFTFIYTATQPWFIPYIMPLDDDVEDRRSMQGTAIFCVSTFQYITLAIIYSKGLPYRKPFFNNKPMCLSLAFFAVLSAVITIVHPALAVKWLEFDPIPYIEDRIFLLLLAVLSGLCSYLFETYFIEHIILGVRERFKKRRQLNTGSKDANRFERILNTIGTEPQWIRTQTTAGLRSEPALAASPTIVRTDETLRLSNGHSANGNEDSGPLILTLGSSPDKEVEAM